MRRTSRLLVMFGVVALAAGATGPLRAHAADGDTDVVVFQGKVSTAPVLVPLIGGPAAGIAFGYVGNTCEIVSADGEFGACNLTLPGPNNYTNIVCGTGPGGGMANLYEPQDLQNDGPFPYAIELVAGIGVIGGGATGVVELTPDPNQGLAGVGTCGDSFIATGVAKTD